MHSSISRLTTVSSDVQIKVSPMLKFTNVTINVRWAERIFLPSLIIKYQTWRSFSVTVWGQPKKIPMSFMKFIIAINYLTMDFPTSENWLMRRVHTMNDCYIDKYDHNPKLSYFFFNSSILSFVAPTFFSLLIFCPCDFSLLLELRRVILRGTPSILNYFARLEVKNLR